MILLTKRMYNRFPEYFSQIEADLISKFTQIKFTD
jgi:hypothetical protein